MSRREAADDPVESVCPRCSVGCRLRYSERRDGAVGCDGAPVNTEGRLCRNGIQAFDGLDAENRLTKPLIREDGDLVAATWDEAFSRIDDEFERILDRHGSDALSFLGAPRCTNEENYLLQKLARVLGTNNVDNRARICHGSVVRAMVERLGSPGMTNTLSDLPEADAFFVVGADPAKRQPIAFNSYVRPAVNDGATLIQIDPGENETTRLADVHVAPNPGTDALFVRAVVAELLDMELIDGTFVAERTADFDAFAESLEGLSAEACADRTGVDAETVRGVAEAFGRADRAAIIAGTGAEEDDHRGTATADALIDLLLVTGNIGKRGTGMNLLRGLTNEQGANDVGCRPSTLPGFRPVSDPDARATVAEEWGIDPPSSPGLSELDAVRAFGDSIHGAYVIGENPAVSKRETQAVARSLEALDFLLVQEAFPTETVEHADVVLPVSLWAEKNGTVTNLDRQVQRMRPITTPPDGVRHDHDILVEIGRRLTDARFEYDRPSDVFDELTRVNPLYAGMSYDGIGHGSQRWPFPAGAEKGTEILHTERFRTGRKRTAFEPVDGFWRRERSPEAE
ncbi:molybdopterin-dependent oxidoreductase [Haladaptatus sp. DYF46]|uniref:molybdopterin oxidoreductase family protein n=1 Tax=Haladaptatus sp. DYF46 TaxID=2886041 RepID=UPI001E4D2453|nr:molybdopterin-dependent oxidoreductase [Haladaptatus sp. DYF46]